MMEKLKAALKKFIRAQLCKAGWHGPIMYGDDWGRCDEPFVRQCPHCGMRWYGDEIEYYSPHHGYALRSIGDWKTRKQCIAEGIWKKDKFEGQIY